MQYTTTLQLIGGGRVTIPEAIRKALGLKDGDLVQLIVSQPQGNGASSEEKEE